MRTIRVYDKILKKYIPFNGCYSFEDLTLVFEEGTGKVVYVPDKLGHKRQEIFEGDICKGHWKKWSEKQETHISNGIHIGRIYYFEPFTEYVFSMEETEGTYDLICPLNEISSIEILGNKNETPELLKFNG